MHQNKLFLFSFALLFSSLASGESCKTVNSSFERNEKNKPLGWGYYASAGKCEWGSRPGGIDGKRCGYLKVIKFSKASKKSRKKLESVSCALLLGRGNGYSGKNAITAFPGRPYKLSFWVKTDPSWLAGSRYFSVNLIGWKTLQGLKRDRTWSNIKNKLKVSCKKDGWKQFSGEFTVPDNIRKMNIGFRIGGIKNSEFTGGMLELDDVKLVPLFRLGVFNGGNTLGARQIIESAKTVPGIKISVFKQISMENLAGFDAVVIPDCKGFGENVSRFWQEAIRSYVENCGGAVIFYHDSVGAPRSPFGRKPLFPGIVTETFKESSWPKPYRIIVAGNQHPITSGWRPKQVLPLMYVDVIAMKTGPEGRILCKTPQGMAAIVVGKAGKGLAVYNGTIIFDRPGKLYSSISAEDRDIKAHGTDLTILRNTINWLAARKQWLDTVTAEKEVKKFRELEAPDRKNELVILPEPQNLNIEKGTMSVSSGNKAEAIIVIGDNPGPGVKAAVRMLTDKIISLHGRILLKKSSELNNEDRKQYNLIVIGTVNNKIGKSYLKLQRKLFSGNYELRKNNIGNEGYVIRCFKNKEGRDVLLGAGIGEIGDMYAAYTIRWLIKAAGKSVRAGKVNIRDWPEIELRAVSCALFPSYLEREKFSGEVINNAKKQIDWFSAYKVNMINLRIKTPLGGKLSVTTRENLDNVVEIFAYAHSRGVKISMCFYSSLGCRKHCFDSFCFSDPEAIKQRRQALGIVRDKLKPDLVWLHAHDGVAKSLEKRFHTAGTICPECAKRFKTRAQYESAGMRMAKEELSKGPKPVTVACCCSPYDVNLAGKGFEAERSYLAELGKLTPGIPIYVARENPGKVLKQYRDITGKKIYVYQAHYDMFDSRNYKDKDVIAGVFYHHWFPGNELAKTVAGCLFWKLGDSSIFPRNRLEAICRELYGPKAGLELAAVLVPNYFSCGNKFNYGETRQIAKRLRFCPEDLKERIAGHEAALAALDKAAQFRGGFFPELTEKTIIVYRQMITSQLKWYKICQLYQHEKNGKLKKILPDYLNYLETKKPRNWKWFYKTANKIVKKLGENDK